MQGVSKTVLAAATFLLSYTTSCTGISKNTDLSMPSYVQTKQFNANNPIEDRIHIGTLDRINGIAVSVFDGHGGDLCADYVAGNIHKVLNARIKHNLKSSLGMEAKLTKSLQQCYDDLENGFKAIFSQNIDKIEYQRVGSCALTALITPYFVLVANAGDCEGVFVGGHETLKTNERLNAGQISEQERLKKQFPDEPDIFKCLPKTDYCYVKGRLQPTRSFGDFYLKNSQYNFTSLRTFTGPYITHKPKITRFELTKHLGKTLVLATDGLWDELDEKQVSNILQPHHCTNRTAEVLLEAALRKILSRNRISSLEKLLEIPNRRNLHDDISIVTVDLGAFLEDYDPSFLRGF